MDHAFQSRKYCIFMQILCFFGKKNTGTRRGNGLIRPGNGLFWGHPLLPEPYAAFCR
jgi:hypothetical protein